MEIYIKKETSDMDKIMELMKTILMCPNGVNNNYRPVKNTSKNDCYNVLGQLQDILKTNSSYPRNLEEEIRKPLEDEIVSLERYISQLEYWKSYWYNSYDEIRNKSIKGEK